MKNNSLRVVLAQLNLTVGDIPSNLDKHMRAAIEARDQMAADMIVFPELSLTGYPAEDLFLRHEFIEEAAHALQQLVTSVKGIYCVVGHPQAGKNHRLLNACSILHNGKILATYAKQRLPNYEVFDEYRYFKPGKRTCVVNIKGIPCGFVICEDLWKLGPTHAAVMAGAKLIISLNASPFEIDKHEKRLAVLAKRAQCDHVPVIYVNGVGGHDELIFDGGSMLINADGELCQHAGFFQEKNFVVDISVNPAEIVCATIQLPSAQERIYQGLMTSLRDYVEKNHFPGVLLGLSGGIDSALVLAIAVDTLGKDKVRAIMMPSPFTAEMSLIDAKKLAETLGVQYEVIPLESVYTEFLDILSDPLQGSIPDLTQQNIQARCRAVILMALSNASGALVLTTGNRSELAVGYCTLYGDMAGGFDLLKDVPKLLVYQLALHRNQKQPVIPQRIIDRPPSAELAKDQKDEDTLPSYALLDAILDYYINQSKSMAEIIAMGFDAEIVSHVIKLIRQNEYKRKQAPLGPRINQKAFGKDWRYPVTNGFRK